MKIVCDACSAKYSISDDKVQGKVFKIRCRKCQNIIVVKGGAQAAEAAPAPAFEKETRVYDYNDGEAGAAASNEDQVWYVVVDQDQVGPLSVAEVQQKFASGQIDAETYIWRDTFSDWLPIGQVDTFAFLTNGGATENAAGALFGSDSPRAAAPDLFSTSAAQAAASGGGDDEGDLFGRGAAPAPVSSSVIDEPKMRGQRNENSVLFSLNNLAALASDSPKPAASKSASGGGGSMLGAASGEGSGLIDIRSMASAYMGDKGGGPAKKPGSLGVGSIDDLPVFSAPSFSEPAVLMPMGGSSTSNNKLLYGLIAGVAVLGILVVALLLRGGGSSSSASVAANKDKDKVAATSPSEDKDKDKDKDKGDAKEPVKVAVADTGSGANPPTANGNPEAATPATPATPATGPGTTATPATPATPTAKADPKPKDPKPSTTTTTKPSSTATKPDPAPTKPDPAPSSGGCDEVACVLDPSKACCKKAGSAKPTTTTASNSNLPAQLDKDMISAGVSKISGKAQSCGGQSSAKGVVKVGVKVGSDGKVTNVTVKQTPDPALGSCVASAMQRATFGKTQNGGSFSYPFSF